MQATTGEERKQKESKGYRRRGEVRKLGEERRHERRRGGETPVKERLLNMESIGDETRDKWKGMKKTRREEERQEGK